MPAILIAELSGPEQPGRSKCNQKVDCRRPSQLLFDCMIVISFLRITSSYRIPSQAIGFQRFSLRDMLNWGNFTYAQKSKADLPPRHAQAPVDIFSPEQCLAEFCQNFPA